MGFRLDCANRRPLVCDRDLALKLRRSEGGVRRRANSLGVKLQLNFRQQFTDDEPFEIHRRAKKAAPKLTGAA